MLPGAFAGTAAGRASRATAVPVGTPRRLRRTALATAQTDFGTHLRLVIAGEFGIQSCGDW